MQKVLFISSLLVVLLGYIHSFCSCIFPIIGVDQKRYILGYKTEGILRQAADVEHVERRISEYEKGWLVPLMH